MTSLSDPSNSPDGSPAGSPSKVCVVCGDKSYGLNFNAITCESCKAFFRRNALSKKHLVCPFSNRCTINRVTRRFCQKCRLEKCLSVGMRKEHIMSEEDKLKKRKKIESNRARKNAHQGGGGPAEEAGDEPPPVKVKKEELDDSEGALSLLEADKQQQSQDHQSTSRTTGTPTAAAAVLPTSTPEESFVWPTLDSSPTEMVNSIIESPVGSTRVIGHLMKTPDDAILAMEKILNSPKDAIQMISHFINSPGDALKIISKIMNSPFDALTIFTKFMSSPTDALEVITKVIQSPNDVLQFLQQLMRSPEDGLDIMNKFMSAPAEALRMINSMMNQTGRVDSTTGEGSPGGAAGSSGSTAEGRSNLIEIQPSDSIMNNSAQLKVILDRMGEHLSSSGGSPTSTMPSSSTVDAEFESMQVKEGPAENVVSPNPNPSVPTTAEESSMHSLAALFGGGGGSFGGQTTTQDIIDMLITQSVNAVDSVVLSEAIKLEYECAMPLMSGMPNASPSMYTMSPPPSNGGAMGDVRPLNDVEQAKLNELILAHQALYAPVHEDISSLIADDYRLKVSGGDYYSLDTDLGPLGPLHWTEHGGH